MAGSFSSLARVPLGGIPFATPAIDDDDEPLENVGRRRAPRLRLSIPARLVTTAETKRCVLLDVSRLGAQIGLAQPMAEGEAGFLRFADFEVFACVIRAGTGFNGVEFDCELTNADVLATRHFAECYEAGERAELMAEARAWVTGGR